MTQFQFKAIYTLLSIIARCMVVKINTQELYKFYYNKINQLDQEVRDFG